MVGLVKDMNSDLVLSPDLQHPHIVRRDCIACTERVYRMEGDIAVCVCVCVFGVYSKMCACVKCVCVSSVCVCFSA